MKSIHGASSFSSLRSTSSSICKSSSLQSKHTAKSYLSNLFSADPLHSKYISTFTFASAAYRFRHSHHRHHSSSIHERSRASRRQFSTPSSASTIPSTSTEEIALPIPIPIPIPTENKQLFKTFHEFSPIVAAPLVSSLKRYSIKTPTAFQCEAYTAISYNSTTLLAAEDGSGKTLAYMLPILSDLLKRPRSSDSTTPSFSESNPVSYTNPRYPRAIVITLTYELCVQLKTLIKALAGKKLRIGIFTGKSRFPTTTMYDVDILLCTPRMLPGLANSISSFAKALEYVVVDEASLINLLWEVQVQHFLTQIQNMHNNANISHTLKRIFVTTYLAPTTPTSFYAWFLREFPESAKVISSSIHTIPPAVRHEWVRVHSTQERDKAVIKTLSMQPLGSRVLIIATAFADCKYAYQLIRKAKFSKKINVQYLSIELDQAKRMKILKHWNQTIGGHTAVNMTSKGQQSVDVLIIPYVFRCGSDFSNNISTLISFDFPDHVKQFINCVSCLGRRNRFSSTSPPDMKAVHIGMNLNGPKLLLFQQLSGLDQPGTNIAALRDILNNNGDESVDRTLKDEEMKLPAVENSDVSNSTDQTLQDITSIISDLESYYSDKNIQELHLQELKELLSTAEVATPGFLNSLFSFAINEIKKDS